MQVGAVLEDYCFIKIAKCKQFAWSEKANAIAIFAKDSPLEKERFRAASRSRQEETIIRAKPKQCCKNVPTVNRRAGDRKLTRITGFKFSYI
jgi:hypothetical protein